VETTGDYVEYEEESSRPHRSSTNDLGSGKICCGVLWCAEIKAREQMDE